MMEWVLTAALYWWMVVATLIVTAIIRAGGKKPQVRTVSNKPALREFQQHTKKF